MLCRVLLVTVAVAAARAHAHAGAQTFASCAEERAVLQPTTFAGPGFGRSVALDGDTLALGGVGLFGMPEEVVVFRLEGGTWREEARLRASPPVDSTLFGHALALDGDRLAVSAPRVEQTVGAVYVFERTGTSWTQQARLVPGMMAGGFGSSLALGGDTLVVGTPEVFADEGLVGAAFVFRRRANGWAREAVLPPAGAAHGARAGDAVALWGNRLAVGAPRILNSGGTPGQVALFTRNPDGSWDQEAILSSSDPLSGDGFGRAISLRNSELIVGSPWRDGRQGKVFLFRRVQGQWTETGQLDPEGTTPTRDFGTSLAVDGDHLLVGASEGFGAPGTVHFYRREGDWTSLARIRPSTTTIGGEKFGWSVALEGSTAVVGTQLGDGTFVFELGPECPRAFCVAKLNSLFCYPVIESQGFASASSPWAFRIVGRDIVPGETGVLLYGLGGRGNLPFHGGRLCVRAPFVRLFPAQSSGDGGSGLCAGVLRTDFNARIQAGVDPALEPGARVVAQWIYSDPAVDPFGDGLTEALEFVVGP